MEQLKGCIIAESLIDPTVINPLPVYRAHISAEELKVDEHGGRGRWHLYWVTCDGATRLPDVLRECRQCDERASRASARTVQDSLHSE